MKFTGRFAGLTAAILMILTATLLPAQIPRTQIRFAYGGLINQTSTVTPSELTVLENRMVTHLLEVAREENYAIVNIERKSDFLTGFPFGENISSFLSVRSAMLPANSRGVIVGQLTSIGSRIYIDLQIYSLSSGDLLLAQSADFAEISEGISAAPDLVRSLFGLDPQDSASGIAAGVRAQASDTEFQRPSLAYIAGTWQGDTGLGTVNISPDGSGVAELAGNNSMRIRVIIDGDKVRIRQDEPNSPKLYLSLFPYNIAQQIVELARPMSWEFRLAADGKSLIGEKFTSYFFIEDGQISRVDNTYSREATWTRID